ncbi:hypothetical protein [Microbulbifer agarilyticus]|uniref:hypothetical protein n=1 Tax=Microbulbifer agarilyticus TaxID=260552 RepID=UPI001CD7D73B|nr:hypothetical protein [Microbulbifer agarilyticus]MCA0892265.1 hypothetical protein [Microbulbifer agarilyticus]
MQNYSDDPNREHAIPRLQIAALICLLVASWLSLAGESRTEPLQFAKGATGASVSGKIQGYDGVNYTLAAKAGQQMTISLTSPHTATYFNIYGPGTGPGDAAIFIGSIKGERFSEKLATSGTYTIQIYMMRSAARRNESAPFTLQVEIDSKRSSRSRKEKNPSRLAASFDPESDGS